MLQEKEFRAFLVSRNADESLQQFSVALIDDFSQKIAAKGFIFPDPLREDIRYYSQHYIAGTYDAYERIVALARYCRFIGHEAGLTYLVTMCGTIGVLESMEARMKIILGNDEAEKILRALEKPPLGSVYEAYPPVVSAFLSSMQKSVPENTCKKILAGNHHGIPLEHFERDKEMYYTLGSMDGYLRFRHTSMLEEMETCMNENRLWYEQKITPDVLEFVRANQEIQAGIREGNRVYITKIPYNPVQFLVSKDVRDKRFHACHCPFVRSSIQDDSIHVSPMWCYCTGGFEKTPFDVIFGKELEVTVLETVLGGNERCRFAVTLPEDAYLR